MACFFSRRVVAALLCIGLAGCATPPIAPLTPADTARLASLLPADALLVGEQHDAPEHQRLQRQIVQWLADRQQLVAVAMEMAERGHTTAALPTDASAAQVRQALAWDDAGWPWKTYGPVVMTAVRAGVPVLGANLPRAQLRAAMQDATLDAHLPPPMLAEQERRIREGHCNALPESQIRPMTRVQIARDRAMAEVVASARQPGHTVLLVAGNGHVQRGLGVPAHLAPQIQVKVLSAQTEKAQEAPENEAAAEPSSIEEGIDLRWPTAPVPPRDHCAGFRASAPR